MWRLTSEDLRILFPRDGNVSYTQDAMVLEELLDRIISMGKSRRSNEIKAEAADAGKMNIEHKGENDE